MSSRSVFHNGEEIVPNYGTDPEGLEGLRTGDTVRVEVHDNGEVSRLSSVRIRVQFLTNLGHTAAEHQHRVCTSLY